jgi:hypothetical protein
MRNNSKTSVIDCGGYRSSFDVIFFLWLGHWLLMTDTWFNLKGGLWNRGGDDEGQRRRWWNSGGGYRSVLSRIGMGMRGGGAPKLI